MYAGRRALVLRLLGSAAFVAAGVVFLRTSIGGIIGDVIGAVGIAFFGPAGVYFLAEIVHRRPSVQIDADGMTDRSSLASAGRIGWDEIGAVRIYSLYGQRMLGILPLDRAVSSPGPDRCDGPCCG